MSRFSILDSLFEGASVRHGIEPDQVTQEQIMEALQNFLGNNVQNDSMPIVRRHLTDMVDTLGMRALAKLAEENPTAARLLFQGEGELPIQGEGAGAINPDDLTTALGLEKKPLESLLGVGQAYDQTGRRQRGEMPFEDYSDEEIASIAQALDAARGKVNKNAQGQELSTLIADMAGQGDGTAASYRNPATMADSALAAMESVNLSRAQGPYSAKGYGDETGRMLRGEMDDLPGDLTEQDPIINAVEMLRQSGLDDEEILQALLGSLKGLDDTFFNGRQGLDSAAPLMDEGALMEEAATTPRVGGGQMDPELMMQVLGLR